MPAVIAKVSTPLPDSFRVRQIAGLFDLPLLSHCTEEFTVDLPATSEPWQIGVIVGPSGSGKSTIARQAFSANLYQGHAWPANRALIDVFPQNLSIKQITTALTAVGLSSPPSWLKPYPVLSNGEKFRCDLAMALLRKERRSDEGTERPGEGKSIAFLPSSPASLGPSVAPSLTVFDEFTSVVDRTVARIASAALSQSIRNGRIAKRFVAVTCHYDIIPWLAPDWVLDMAGGVLSRGCLPRPKIQLKIRRVTRDLWRLFKRHHYLNTHLHPSAACFAGFVDDSPAAFTAVLPFPHPRRPGYREHRTVCLPDFQGVGIGSAMSNFVAACYIATGKPYFSTTSHPSLMRHRARSALWRTVRKPQLITSPHAAKSLSRTTSLHRVTASFEYIGPARHREARSFGVACPGTIAGSAGSA